VRARLIYRERGATIPPYLPANLGIREEYALRWDRAPQVYISPVDARLHLKGAERGIIIYSARTTDNGPTGADFNAEELTTGKARTFSKVEYEDLDRDGYVDRWVWYRDDQPVAGLYVGRGRAVYHDSDGLRVKSLPASPVALAEMSPPRDTAEWSALHAALVPHTARRTSLADLEGIFAALPGEPWSAPGVRVLSVRPIDGGLDLVVRVEAIALPALRGAGIEAPLPARAGESQVLRFSAPASTESRAPAASLQAIAPARLAVPGGGVTFSNDQPSRLTRTRVTVQVRNDGGDAAPQSALSVLERAGGRTRELARRLVTLDGGSQEVLVAHWTPLSSGPTEIIVQVRGQPGGEANDLASVPVVVSDRPTVGWRRVLEASTDSPLVVLLAAAAVAAASVAHSFLGASGSPDDVPEEPGA
jgi:hypothetical protein